MCVTDGTHVVSWLIVLRTMSLRSFNLFPPSPLSRAVQTSAQASQSSTYSTWSIIASWVHLSLQPVNKKPEGNSL